MEDIVYAILCFGGATLVLLAFSPIGRGLADRIRRRGGASEPDPAVLEELARLLRRAVDSPEERRAKGAAGRARILAGFTWSTSQRRTVLSRLAEASVRPSGAKARPQPFRFGSV